MIIITLIILALVNQKQNNQEVESKSLFGSSDCTTFNPPVCTYGTSPTLTFYCYNTTNVNCFSGRQLSSPMPMTPDNANSAGFLQFLVISIVDSAGKHYNVQSTPQVDLNISLYEDCSPGVDPQLCGYLPTTGMTSTSLAEGQYIWICGNHEYYIGVNNGDNANISASQFYVCFALIQVAENSGTYMQVESLGMCVYRACDQIDK